MPAGTDLPSRLSKGVKRLSLIVFLFLLCLPLAAQKDRPLRPRSSGAAAAGKGSTGSSASGASTAQGSAASQGNTGVITVSGTPMFYEVIDGDTLFVDSLDPVWVFPKGRRLKSGDWRKEYRLVYNFNKVYPYALVARKLMRQVDSTIAVDVSKRSQRNAYTHDVMLELFWLFEKDIRSMTITQGVLLMRLVDRECGMSPYDIVKTYRSGFTAGFWQMIAKLFGTNLKSRYQPEGLDKKTEQLIQKWESGDWDRFYYSIFYELPKKTVIKSDVLTSSVKSREDRRHREESDAKEQSVMRRALDSALE